MTLFLIFQKDFSIDTTIEDLEGGVSQPDAVVNSQIRLNIPILMRDSALLEERNLFKMERLINSILQILTVCLKNRISIINRLLLLSSLSTLAKSPTLPTTVRVCVDQCLVSLNSFEDGPFVLIETDEFQSMKEAAHQNSHTTSNQNDEIAQLNHTIATLQRQLKEHEEMLTREREEKKAAEEKAERAKEREQAAESAKRDAEIRIEQLLIEKQNLENSLNESKEREKKTEERETKVNEREMKANADRREAEQSRKKMEEEKKKAETERAKMEEEKRRAEEKTRNEEEAKRMAEERQKHAEEQKGQAQRDKEKLSDEVWRIRKDFREAREEKETSEREKKEMAETMKWMRMMIRTEWKGTESLLQFDRTAHKLTPTTLTQIIKLEGNTDWRTAYTGPIDEGDWELKIKAKENTFVNVMLGFLRHPLPDNALQKHSGSYYSGIGGDFVLWNGKMWKNGEFKPEGTNKKCERTGQTAAIRVNMWRREATLLVDEVEQPGIFTDIPTPLCLGITTCDQNQQIEVLWFKRLRS
ncbi:hypothetical protein BLNAU_9860 [Blattamonas nauphoetae]|uniref:Uncharacterized protein n=1 Tax=Blattamonas nauphoetae TaxID=2049346 RepID=A0ABQ9XUH5_9EUKA|nr:hypothetical protein BLNAU_9860 [Blattamonas nauphoetae]